MKLGSSNYLGLSVNDRAIACAEISVQGERRVLRRMAVFPLAGETSLAQPAAAGQALASFLREHRFSASRAVVGVPAKWLVATERDLPPSDAEQARSILRLHAERMSVAESGDMVCDYVGQPDRNRATRVLLVTMLRDRLERVESLLESAGITVLAVSSSSLVLASASASLTARGAGAANGDGPMVILEKQGAEVVWRTAGEPRLIKHVSAPAANGHLPIGPLGLELSRAVALSGGGGSRAATLPLWDGVGLDDGQVDELAQRMGVRLAPADTLKDLGVTDGGSAPPAVAGSGVRQFASSVALGLAGADRKLLPLDFKRSRLTPPRRKPLSRATTLSIIGGALLVLLLGGLWLMTYMKQSALDQVNADMTGLASSITKARSTTDRMNVARGYYDARPPMLECLREITESFRDRDPMWATNFTVREPGDTERRSVAGAAAPAGRRGQLNGKAADQKTVLDLLERLHKNRKFAEVKLQGMQEAGGRSKDVMFTINFIFVASE